MRPGGATLWAGGKRAGGRGFSGGPGSPGADGLLKHANIAFFIPHNGCPHQCSFCDQRSITGQKKQPSPEEIGETLRRAADQMGERAHEAEIAFFGGSFTAIEGDYRRALLSAATPFIRRRIFAGIRISTRPDSISSETLEELQEAGVTAIELGA